MHRQRTHASLLKFCVTFQQTHHHQRSTCFTLLNNIDSPHLVTNYLPVLKIFLVVLILAILSRLTVDNLGSYMFSVCTNNGICTRLLVSKYNHSCGTTIELNNVIRKYLNGGAIEADSRASALVGPSVATPLKLIKL